MGFIFLKLKLKKTPHFLAAHGVKIDFMVGYFTQSTDFCFISHDFDCLLYSLPTAGFGLFSTLSIVYQDK